jgi:hypothetical protein
MFYPHCQIRYQSYSLPKYLPQREYLRIRYIISANALLIFFVIIFCVNIILAIAIVARVFIITVAFTTIILHPSPQSNHPNPYNQKLPLPPQKIPHNDNGVSVDSTNIPCASPYKFLPAYSPFLLGRRSRQFGDSRCHLGSYWRFHTSVVF